MLGFSQDILGCYCVSIKARTVGFWRAEARIIRFGCGHLTVINEYGRPLHRAMGHAESVGAVVIGKKLDENGRPRFIFSGSQDRTIKMWDLLSLPAQSNSGKGEMHKCKSLTTHKAHDKDINALDVSPNDLFLASGSQDKTAKVYEISYAQSGSGSRGEVKLLGTCKGHKRGVWSVKFGRLDKVLRQAAVTRP